MSETRSSIVGEHRALHQLRDALRRDVAAVPDGREDAWHAGVAARLAQLRARLEAHFLQEERAGLFEHLAEGGSEHAPAATRLRREHDALRASLERLRAAGGEPKDSAHVLAERVRTFLDDLAAHEDRENELMVRGLDGSVAASD
jgi:iron-sulfur cluster repair protein YtfE (RIC family)